MRSADLTTLAAPRGVTGRFTPAADPCGVVPVVLPTGRVGYRIGMDGIIHATEAAARKHAANRAAKLRAALERDTRRDPVTDDDFRSRVEDGLPVL